MFAKTLFVELFIQFRHSHYSQCQNLRTLQHPLSVPAVALCCAAGGLAEGWWPDHPRPAQEGHHPQLPGLRQPRGQQGGPHRACAASEVTCPCAGVEAAPARRGGGWPRLLHVPDQHGAHEAAERLPRRERAARHRLPADQQGRGGAGGGERDAGVPGQRPPRPPHHLAPRGRRHHRAQPRPRQDQARTNQVRGGLRAYDHVYKSETFMAHFWHHQNTDGCYLLQVGPRQVRGGEPEPGAGGPGADGRLPLHRQQRRPAHSQQEDQPQRQLWVRLLVSKLDLWFTVVFAVAPEILVPNQLLGYQFGSRVVAECLVEAYPNTINYWMKHQTEMLLNKWEIYPSDWCCADAGVQYELFAGAILSPWGLPGPALGGHWSPETSLTNWL